MFPIAVKGFFNPKIDRSKISEIVFNNKEKLEQLTATITPLVVAEIQKRAKKVKENLFVEVPILFERGYQNQFDKVIIITRAMEDRINSVKIRSNLSKEQVLDRIKNQFDYENADLSPYFSIQNDGSAEVLKQKLLDAIKNI
jgi:dephospho-CoA kinase